MYQFTLKPESSMINKQFDRYFLRFQPYYPNSFGFWEISKRIIFHLYLLFRYFSISKSCVYGVAQALHKKQLLLVNNPKHQKHRFCATIFTSLANDQRKEYYKTVVGCPSTRDSRCEHGKSTYFSRALQNDSSNKINRID